jgi:hypothetical protein
MSSNSSIMPEQVSLFDRSAGQSTWSRRLVDDDPLHSLGETFVVNSLVTPTPNGAASVIAPQSTEEAGRRLAAASVSAADDLYRTDDWAGGAPPAFLLDELSTRLGVDVHRMPRGYAGWRLSVEVYALFEGAVYLLLDDLAVRMKVLSEDEYGMAYVQRLMPFVGSSPDAMTGTMLFLVSVPSRLAALGGLRGHRRALMEATRAEAALASLVRPEMGRFEWDTEFYDDVCAAILDVDGVERVPLVIGYQTIPDEDGIEQR